MPATRPIMICMVSDGWCHGRRDDCVPIACCLAQTMEAARCSSSGERRLPACSCRQLAGNIFAHRAVVASQGVSASCRDGQAGSLCSPKTRRHARCTLNCFVFLTHLECTSCGLQHEWVRLQNMCTACGKPLFAIVDLAGAGRALNREKLSSREKSLWRYRELLPLPKNAEPISLGEGGTPLLRAKKFADGLDVW